MVLASSPFVAPLIDSSTQLAAVTVTVNAHVVFVIATEPENVGGPWRHSGHSASSFWPTAATVATDGLSRLPGNRRMIDQHFLVAQKNGREILARTDGQGRPQRITCISSTSFAAPVSP
jgi:hypothetical protein